MGLEGLLGIGGKAISAVPIATDAELGAQVYAGAGSLLRGVGSVLSKAGSAVGKAVLSIVQKPQVIQAGTAIGATALIAPELVSSSNLKKTAAFALNPTASAVATGYNIVQTAGQSKPGAAIASFVSDNKPAVAAGAVALAGAGALAYGANKVFNGKSTEEIQAEYTEKMLKLQLKSMEEDLKAKEDANKLQLMWANQNLSAQSVAAAGVSPLIPTPAATSSTPVKTTKKKAKKKATKKKKPKKKVTKKKSTKKYKKTRRK